jgi:hypothetical protein
LYKLRLSNPAEFKVAVPGLKADELSIAFNSLSAFASIWDAADSFEDRDPEGVERNINRAVKHLINCGVPADDVGLNKFRESYLIGVQKLCQTAAAG